MKTVYLIQYSLVFKNTPSLEHCTAVYDGENPIDALCKMFHDFANGVLDPDVIEVINIKTERLDLSLWGIDG
jgi:hypothetical protein